MGKPMFTPEDLAEMAAFDAEIDADDEITLAEYKECQQRDMQALDARRDHADRKRAAYKRKYNAEHKDEIAAYMRKYRRRKKQHDADCVQDCAGD